MEAWSILISPVVRIKLRAVFTFSDYESEIIYLLQPCAALKGTAKTGETISEGSPFFCTFWQKEIMWILVIAFRKDIAIISRVKGRNQPREGDKVLVCDRDNNHYFLWNKVTWKLTRWNVFTFPFFLWWMMSKLRSKSCQLHDFTWW